MTIVCESCGTTENLIESGGQFSGGTWYVCVECDNKWKKFQEWLKWPEFLETLKRIEKKGLSNESYSNK